jgi:nucleotide-binding universal stress UspA family protein
MYAGVVAAASRGRNAMKKAMMGSMTDSVIQRVSCPCLVVKPQVGH